MTAHRDEPKWRRYLRLARPNPAADLDDELRDHLESTIESLIGEGMSPEAARTEATRRFGNVDQVRAETRRIDERHFASARRSALLETILYDVRHAARGMMRSPGFALVAALSIGLGVAANATVFSVVNALLLRQIPGTHSDRLMRMYVNHHSPFDWHDLSWFREHSRSLENVVGERYNAIGFRAMRGDESERVQMSYVTKGFFSTLGVRMAAGRAFDSDEITATASEPVAVLSYPFWQRRFGGDSSVIGKTISLADHPLVVVGIAAPDFRSSVMTWAPDVFVPFSAAPILTGRRIDEFGGSFYTTVRLRPDVTSEQAEKELRVLMLQLARTDSARYERVTVRLDHVRGVNAEMRQAVAAGSIFLMGMVGMVLLIACANVANLLLGRAAARRTEIGVRLAIGASRARLVQQLLTESFLLAALGSAIGLATAFVLTRFVSRAIPPEAGLDAGYFSPDGRVVLFTAVLCLLTTLIFGAMPALRAASPNLIGILRGDANPSRIRKRGALVSIQAAMCVVLLAVAALFLRSLSSLQQVDPGFRAEGIVDVNVDLNLLGAGADKPATMTALVKQISAIPSVEAASLTAVVPLSGSNSETRVLPEGMEVASRRDAPSVYFHIVGPRYFEMMRIPMRRGREFAETDRDGAPRVAVISEAAARRLWPDGDAIGKRFHWGSVDGELVQVVGIAKDANYVMPGETPKTVIYMPYAQESRGEMTIQLRTGANVANLRRAIWDAVRAAVPTLPPPPVTRMIDDMAIVLLPVRLGAALLGAFGALALLLAAAGIYGVASYSVARRTREIGIRSALGATRSRLVGMVLWESGRRVGVGAIVGLLLSIGIGAALSRVLYGVRPADPVVLGEVTLVIAAIAMLATLAPARRAAQSDPVAAMRTE